MSSIEIFLSIVLAISCIFSTLIVIDKAIFVQKTKNIRIGMTGKEVQDETGLKIRFLKIEGNSYYALVQSKLTVFKLRLVFVDGQLLSKQGF